MRALLRTIKHGTLNALRLYGTYARTLFNGPATRRLFDNVESFCLFIGYPRSGHSLVGSLLNAHPDAVIAHELDALFYLEKGFGRNQLFKLLMERDQWFTNAGSKWMGYDYSVPNQWQGRYRQLRVIGDKKGGGSSAHLLRNPRLLQKLQATVRVPLRIIHITRNPFDNITTMSQRSQRPLQPVIDDYFGLCHASARVMREVPSTDVVTTRHEAIVANPVKELEKLANFLGLECTPDYLKDCAALVFESPSKTRTKVPWSGDLVHQVEDRSKQFEFLEGYSYAA